MVIIQTRRPQSGTFGHYRMLGNRLNTHRIEQGRYIPQPPIYHQTQEEPVHFTELQLFTYSFAEREHITHQLYADLSRIRALE